MEKNHGKKIFFFSAQATASVHFQTTRHKKRMHAHAYILIYQSNICLSLSNCLQLFLAILLAHGEISSRSSDED